MKAYKVELLILDFDEIGEAEIADVIRSAHYPNHCIAPDVKKIESREIGEWSDDHPLNNSETADTAYKELFAGQPSINEQSEQENLYRILEAWEDCPDDLYTLPEALEELAPYQVGVDLKVDHGLYRLNRLNGTVFYLQPIEGEAAERRHQADSRGRGVKS